MEVWTNQEQAYYLGLPHGTGSSLRAGAVSPFTLGVLGIPFPGHISILGPLLLPCYGVRVELGPYGVSGKGVGPASLGRVSSAADTDLCWGPGAWVPDSTLP